MKDILLFGNFKTGAARPLLDDLGLHELVEMARSWDDFRKSVQYYNFNNNGVFVQRAHRHLESVSPQENAMLLAVLFAVGLLTPGRPNDANFFLDNLQPATGPERDAIAACIAAGCGR